MSVSCRNRLFSFVTKLPHKALTTMPKNLIVFDFDWSFVDQDTDRWVFEVLDTRLRRTLQDRKSAGSQCMPDVV